MTKVILRKIVSGDAEMLVRWRNENAYAFPERDTLLTFSEHINWYVSSYLHDPARIMFVILADSRPVGTIGLTVRHGRGEVGNMILGDKSYERQGIMQEAVKQMLKAFDLDDYWLKVLPGNQACIRFYEKLGFRISSSMAEDGCKVMSRRRYYEDLAEAMNRSTP